MSKNLFTHTIQSILSLTPFVRPHLTIFLNNADKKGLIGRYPLIGNLIDFFPPLKWLDNKLKYPLLTLGRVLLSILLIIAVMNYTTYNPEFKSFVDKNIITIFTQKPKLADIPKFEGFGGLKEGISTMVSENIRYATESTTHNLKESILAQSLYGAIGALPRGLIFYLLWSLLFYIFGNSIGQREHKAFETNRPYRELGKIFVDNFGVFNTYIQNDPKIDPKLKAKISSKINENKIPVTKEELLAVVTQLS
jgi:hypothetical protein